MLIAFRGACPVGTKGAVHIDGDTGNNRLANLRWAARVDTFAMPPGASKAPEYQAWISMLNRCYKPRDFGYRWYGAKGIKVCDRWRLSYSAFLSDVGVRPSPAHSLDRIDSAADYEPTNVRWATKTQQMRNTSGNRFVVVGGESRCIAEWAEISGVKPKTIGFRLRHGWDAREAVFSPPYGRPAGGAR